MAPVQDPAFDAGSSGGLPDAHGTAFHAVYEAVSQPSKVLPRMECEDMIALQRDAPRLESGIRIGCPGIEICDVSPIFNKPSEQ